jgi:hypothetical protein
MQWKIGRKKGRKKPVSHRVMGQHWGLEENETEAHIMK